MKIKGVLIDVENNIAESREIERSLDTYYSVLNCDLIQVVNVQVNGKYFDIICDEEATFKANQKISAIDSQYKPMLIGNLFVCNTKNGNETSLSEKEIDHVLKCVRLLGTTKHPNPYPILTKVDW